MIFEKFVVISVVGLSTITQGFKHNLIPNFNTPMSFNTPIPFNSPMPFDLSEINFFKFISRVHDYFEAYKRKKIEEKILDTENKKIEFFKSYNTINRGPGTNFYEIPTECKKIEFNFKSWAEFNHGSIFDRLFRCAIRRKGEVGELAALSVLANTHYLKSNYAFKNGAKKYANRVGEKKFINDPESFLCAVASMAKYRLKRRAKNLKLPNDYRMLALSILYGLDQG